jgi:hypothetical protein
MADHAVSHSAATIKAAISVLEEILRLRPIGHEQRAEAVDKLGNALFFFCFYHEADYSRRDRCFVLLREALQLCPPSHSSRDRALHNLARALGFVDYEKHSGSLDNLGESIQLNRAALQLRPAGHPERAGTLNNLAHGLMRSFHRCGNLDLLTEAIAVHRDALLQRPLGHPLRDTSLHNLASSLGSSFQHQGGSETLAEQISLSREALQLQPVGHPLRWIPLNTLGNSLALSFELQGLPALLSESVCVHREAVHLVPSTHPERGIVFGNLAHSLVESFRQYRDQSALSEAITLLRQSLCLPAGLGGDRRLEILYELAEALVASFDEHKFIDHLHEAVKLHREALESRPPGHFQRMESLQGLGRLLCRTECQSWTEAVALCCEALSICPAGSPRRAEALSDASRCFLDSQSPFFDISRGMEHLSAAYSDNFCHVNRRLRFAMSDMPRVEVAYSEAAASFHPFTLEHCNCRIMDLYAQVISLLPRAANFGLDHSTRLQAVTGLDGIARDAAARAVLLGRESEALELLEEGRGVFWAQALHLRTTAFDDVPQEDCQELQRLLRLLEHSGRRVEMLNQNAAQHERDMEIRRQLNEEVEALILKIRGYAGLDRFLLPPTFKALVSALPDGFVVVVNASKLGFHALLLHRDADHASSIKLQLSSMALDSVDLRSHLPREMEPAHTPLADTRAMRKDSGQGVSLLNVLSALWTSIVQPVIGQLGLQVSRQSL